MNNSNKTQKWNKMRLKAIIALSLIVIITGILMSSQALRQGDAGGAILGGLIAVIILIFALIVYKRGNDDLKNGLPIQDERSRRVMDKATSRAFYVSLYLLLVIGFISDRVTLFRDISQAMGLAVGAMGLLFLIFWLYYQKREV